MHRSFYSFAYFYYVLLTIMAMAAAWVYSFAGNISGYLASYPWWVLSSGLFTVIGSVVMLKYLRAKHYNAAFWIGIPASILLLLVTLLNYSQITIGFGIQIYMPVYVLTLFVQVPYSVSVWLSASRENTWLRAAGIFSTVLSFVTFALVCVILSGKFIEYNPAIEKFSGPILWAGVVVHALLAMNFYRELQAHPADEGKQSQANFSFAFNFASLASAIAALVIIVPFVWDNHKTKAWLPGMEIALKKVAEPFEARTYVNAEGDTLRYRLLKPLNFDPSESYPIVVCLHGSSGTGSDNYRQVAASLIPEFISTEANREKYRAFVFVPQCPFGTSWGGTHPLPGIDEIVFEGMAALEQEFRIDPNRRYVTGGSLGGYGTWHFIESHPELFAAAMPICGSGDPSLASRCANIPVWAFHGTHDERVAVSGSRDMINAMKTAGGTPRYTEYPDAGHDIGKRVVDTPGLLDWLFAQQRADSLTNQVR